MKIYLILAYESTKLRFRCGTAFIAKCTVTKDNEWHDTKLMMLQYRHKPNKQNVLSNHFVQKYPYSVFSTIGIYWYIPNISDSWNIHSFIYDGKTIWLKQKWNTINIAFNTMLNLSISSVCHYTRSPVQSSPLLGLGSALSLSAFCFGCDRVFSGAIFPSVSFVWETEHREQSRITLSATHLSLCLVFTIVSASAAAHPQLSQC